VGIIKFVAFIAVLWAGFWLFTAGERENNRHINKAIFPAFRSIEKSCLSEQFPNETVRCQGALALLKRCTSQDNRCAADEYYDKLSSFGFELPPFYEPGYKPR